MLTKKVVNYAVCCKKGFHSKNQDNFWCPKRYLSIENEGLKEGITNTAKIKDFPAFAVFDGMGGEKSGEVAAGIAAATFDKFYRKTAKESVSNFIGQVCHEINNEICTYKDNQQISRMGTTAVVIAFDESKAYFCNIGDSRIYRYRKKELLQISVDHSEVTLPDRKAPLSQHLGIPASEFIIEPYINSEEYLPNDMYILCSDGITDILEPWEMTAILEEDNPLLKKAEIFVKGATIKQGKDDMTIILCCIS